MKEKEIRQALQDLASKLGPDSTMLGIVSSVDQDEKTCVVVNDDNDELSYTVRLRPVVDDKEGLTLFPKDGTWALCIKIDGEWMGLSFGELVKYRIKIQDSTFETTEEGHVFDGGNNGGMVIVQALTDQINAVEDKVNELLSTLQAVIVPLAPSGTYPLATDFGAVTPLNNTLKRDLENEKVKH